MQTRKALIFCEIKWKKLSRGMRDKKPTGNDVPGELLLGGDNLRVIIQLINRISETGEWPTDFTEVTTISLEKRPTATKCSISSSLHIQQR